MPSAPVAEEIRAEHLSPDASDPESAQPLPDGWVVAESPSGWYRILTPAQGFSGPRLGKVFVDGEVVVHTSERRTLPMPGGRKRSDRLVDLFVRDLRYVAEAIPLGVPPVPRSTLKAMSAAGEAS